MRRNLTEQSSTTLTIWCGDFISGGSFAKQPSGGGMEESYGRERDHFERLIRGRYDFAGHVLTW